MEKIRTTLRDTRWGRWTALCMISFTMLCGYYLTDALAPLMERLQTNLNWTAIDYGVYTGGYGWFNVFLFMLIIGGMILDRMGIRFTGVLAILIMLLGAGIKYWAISGHVGQEEMVIRIFNLELFTAKKQAIMAGLGFAVFGVGVEMFGITANKSVIRWFKGKEMALAIGLNTSTGRIGTALAMFTPVPLVNWAKDISAPILLSMVLLCIGLLAFIGFIMFDRKLEKEEKEVSESIAEEQSQVVKAEQTEEEVAEDEKFKLSDILKIAKIRAFWYITILCVLFYSAVFPFIKYATNLIVQKFGISDEFAGYIPALLPFGALFLTPLFGGIYDKKGKGATIMLIGSVILLCVHLLFSIPSLNNLYIAIGLVILLGIGFSLVPSAMWPSVAKIIPENRLGTAYSITFWVQNWGLMGVPMLIGYLLDKYCITGTITKIIDGKELEVTQYNYTLPMLVFACFGALAILFAFLLKKEDAKKGYGLEKPNIEE